MVLRVVRYRMNDPCVVHGDGGTGGEGSLAPERGEGAADASHAQLLIRAVSVEQAAPSTGDCL